jgi:Sensors of blue-light using FAD
MRGSVEQIMYISTARRVAPSEAEVDDILRASRRNNRADGLSGMLIVAERRFLQVLEGPKEQCERAYSRIRSDPRHFALVELGRKTIETRSFPDWAMGFETMGSTDLIEQVEHMTRDITDRSLRAHLLSFAEVHRRAA